MQTYFGRCSQLRNMTLNTNEEDVAKCPVDGCFAEPPKRGLFMHIFQSDDSPGEKHGERFSVPDDIDVSEIKVSGTERIEMEYPDRQDIEEARYLDTYTGKAYQGKRGLMVHLGQTAGRNNIPEDVTDRHDGGDFPIVEIDEDGNVTEVIKEAEGNVPPLDPYVPWYNEEDDFVKREKIENFVNALKNSQTRAASAEAIEDALLEDT